MSDIYTPFDTYFAENPDYNDADALAEAEALFARQRAIEGLCNGRMSADDALMILEGYGVDVDAYVQTAVDNVALLTGIYV